MHKVEPDNFDNCTTRLLSHDRQCLACDNNSREVLNMLITHGEIDKAISSIHNRKSPEPDGLVVEILKNNSEIITPKLYILFNSIMKSGIFPGEREKVLICTLLKGGPLNDPKNYIGISLLDITSKLFTKIRGQKINVLTTKSRQALEKDIAQLIKFCIYLL